MKSHAFILSILPTLLAASCGDPHVIQRPKDWSVDSADAPVLEGELKRLREMQMIKVFVPDPLNDGEGVYEEWDGGTLSEKVTELCHLRHYCEISSGTPTCDDTYVRTACDLSTDLCIAETLHEIADAAVVPIKLRHPEASWMYIIPPQGEAARLAMLQEVRYFARRLTYKALSTIADGGALAGFGHIYRNDHRYNVSFPWLPGTHTGTSGQDCPFTASSDVISTPRSVPKYYPDDGSAVDDGRTYAQVVTAAITTGERLFRTATFEAVDKAIAVAEWDRGSTESLGLAQKRAFSRPLVSRAAAAHMLVGGSEGLRLATEPDMDGEIPTSDAFCTTMPLSPNGQRALKIFREVGISPDDIIGAVSTQVLVDGVLPSGSVRERLSAKSNRTIVSALTELGLSVNDFKEAREHLIQEMRAFNRTRTASLEMIGPFPRFAGTATEPPQRGIEYYTAIARQEAVTFESNENDVTWTNDSLATFHYNLRDVATSYFSAKDSAGTLSAEASEAVRPLYMLAQRLDSEADVWIEFLVPAGPSPSLSYNIRVDTHLGQGFLQFYAGEDAVSCALSGNVEGGACSATPVYQAFKSFSSVMTGTVPIATANDWKARIYIVFLGFDNRRTLLGSMPAFNLDGRDSQLRYARVGDIEKRVYDILRPSPKWCSRAAVECNGDLFDERIALENELNDNADDVENSWRYYLDRAESAAAEADALGQEYLNAQIAADQGVVEAQRFELAVHDRVEQELEIIQRICGISADASTLLGLFGQEGKLETVVDEECMADVDCMETGSPENQVRQCIGSRCVLVPTRLVGSQDVQTISARLAECLGDDQILPYVVLGNRPICVHDAADLCSTDVNCPRVVPDGADPEAFCGEIPSWSSATEGPWAWKPLSETLNFYDVSHRPEFENSRKVIGTNQDCRLVDKSTRVETSWFRRESFSNWISSTGFWRQCEDRASLSTDDQMAGKGTDTSLFDIVHTEYEFAYFESSGGNGGGTSLDLIGCPEQVDFAEISVLTASEQIWLLEQLATCRYQQLNQAMGTRVLSEMPRSIIEVLQQQGPTGVFPLLGGEYAQKVSEFRSLLVGYAENMRQMSEELEGARADLANYRLQMQELGLAGEQLDLDEERIAIERQINRIRLQQVEVEQDGQLFAGVLQMAAIIGAGVVTGGAGSAALVGASAIATSFSTSAVAASSATQVNSFDYQKRIIEASNELLELEAQGIDISRAKLKLQEAKELLATREALRRRMAAIVAYATDAAAKLELMDGKLAALEGDRDMARRALSRAIGAASPQLRESEQRLYRVMSNVARLQKRRYEEAFSNAVRLSFLAKRAIEQRLGVRFAELTQPLPLLDAPPATWENEVCVASGLDYDALRGGDALPESSLNGFVGSYVRKLRNVVDAYQLQYAFHEGRDAMTVSMKEDLFRVNGVCVEPSRNLLRETVALPPGDQAEPNGLTLTGPATSLREIVSDVWEPVGCAGSADCVWVASNVTPIGDFGDLASSRSMLLYGDGGRLRQGIALTAGSYALSWYETGHMPGANVLVLDAEQEEVEPLETLSYESHSDGVLQWYRNVKFIEVPTDGTYHVDLIPSEPEVGGYGWIHAGGLMLERLGEGAQVESPFEGTDSSGMRSFQCTDTDGQVFRAEYWSRHCERLCAQGSTSGCVEDAALRRCYWEAPFALTQREIEGGRVLRNAGFAFGNFNYRIDAVAVNVVGTVRSCNGIGGEACYSIGYVPYSLAHRGPFTVRNHAGMDNAVSLFDGRIETAKALAAERYLSNPLSSADRELISAYMRTELRGRPMDGNFVVRIWEDDGFDFNAVRDVQLLIEYRYWTAVE